MSGKEELERYLRDAEIQEMIESVIRKELKDFDISAILREELKATNPVISKII